ncbi:MAG: hypothetical protein C4554_05925 [Dethiobacter sp.]|nr:MAG: hypothetical protein C4554_05925 [Dethiobacter sp.]
MSWRLVKLNDLEIFVHPFFLLFIFLWILAGLPIQTLFLFVLVLGHELTHMLVAKFYGIKIFKIELFPFGGVGYLAKPLEMNPVKEFMVAGAGPIFNLLMLIILWNYKTGNYGPPVFFDSSLVSFLLKANFFLFFFNLLPGLPLDGGRLLRASLSTRVGLYKATEIAASCGKWLGVFLVILGILLSYFDYLNLSLSLMGIFLYYAAGREQQSAVYVFLRYLLRKEKMLKRYKVIKSEQLVAMESTTVLEVLKRFKPTRYHQVIVLNQACRVLELLSESQILEAALKKGMDIPLRGLLRK